MNPEAKTTPNKESAASNQGSTRGIFNRLRIFAQRFVIWFAISIVVAWCLGGLRCLDHWIPQSLAIALSIVFLVCMSVLLFAKRFRRLGMLLLCGTAIGLMLFFQTRTPTHDRVWSVGQKQLPAASFGASGDTVTMTNVRDFIRDGDETQTRYVTREFDLRQLNSVWLGIDRFADVQPVAHVFISFGFVDPANSNAETYIGFSVETRREACETEYSPLRGIYNHYELIYVCATEVDMLSQRSKSSEHAVQLYPVRADKTQMKNMFSDIARRCNSIIERPEFYHTIRSNCTNNIVAHANHAGTGGIDMWQRGVIFPGWSDWLAFQYELIDTELTLEEARKRFRINERVMSWDGKTDFSAHIRGR